MGCHLLNLPEELLCMIIAYLVPFTNVPIRDLNSGTKIHHVTQIILIRWVSSGFLRLASMHPFWVDPESNMSWLVPDYDELDPRVAEAKVGKLYALLFEDAFIRQALSRRTCWHISEAEAVPLVKNHTSNGDSVTELYLYNLHQALYKTIHDFGKIFPNVRTLGLYDESVGSNDDLLDIRKAWPDLQHLSVDLNTCDGLGPWCPTKLESYHLSFQETRQTCFNVSSHLPRCCGSPIETLTDLTISNSAFTCGGHHNDAADLATLNSFVNLKRLTVPAIHPYLLKLLTLPNLKLEFTSVAISIVSENAMEDLLMFLNYASCLRSLHTLKFTYESSVFTDENSGPVEEVLQAFASKGVKVEKYDSYVDYRPIL
jgi:hypothetical protein